MKKNRPKNMGLYCGGCGRCPNFAFVGLGLSVKAHCKEYESSFSFTFPCSYFIFAFAILRFDSHPLEVRKEEQLNPMALLLLFLSSSSSPSLVAANQQGTIIEVIVVVVIVILMKMNRTKSFLPSFLSFFCSHLELTFLFFPLISSRFSSQEEAGIFSDAHGCVVLDERNCDV